MKKMFLIVVGIALVSMLAAPAYAGHNINAKYALHFAGLHDAKANTCDFTVTDCVTELVTSAVVGAGNYDVYIIALDTEEFGGARFGLECETTLGVPPLIMGFNLCADFDIPEAGWPNCGVGEAVSFVTAQPNGHVTLGILDVYVYPGTNAKLCMGVDPRVGFAEVCDSPVSGGPVCFKTTSVEAFGCVGINRLGYNPCGIIPVEQKSWGAVKSLYR
jgi:hypothetical protein